jgi:PPOX class probable F420-dependent enzyme
MSTIARADRVPREELLTFVRPRHRGVLVTHRADGAPQTSPVSVGVDQQGRVVVSSYPARAKVANLRARPEASLTVLSDDWDGPWVQLDGQV